MTNESIKDVKARYTDEIMALPGVLAVGIGQAPGGGEAIVVSVRRNQQETSGRLPTQLEGHPVVVCFTDDIRAL